MVYKVILTHPAKKYLLFIMDWYDKQQQNLGYKFYEDYVESRHYLSLNPFLFRKGIQGLYELKLSKFPYFIIYDIQDTAVIIYAVFNTSKNPLKKPSKF